MLSCVYARFKIHTQTYMFTCMCICNIQNTLSQTYKFTCMLSCVYEKVHMRFNRPASHLPGHVQLWSNSTGQIQQQRARVGAQSVSFHYWYIYIRGYPTGIYIYVYNGYIYVYNRYLYICIQRVYICIQRVYIYVYNGYICIQRVYIYICMQSTHAYTVMSSHAYILTMHYTYVSHLYIIHINASFCVELLVCAVHTKAITYIHTDIAHVYIIHINAPFCVELLSKRWGQLYWRAFEIWREPDLLALYRVVCDLVRSCTHAGGHAFLSIACIIYMYTQ